MLRDALCLARAAFDDYVRGILCRLFATTPSLQVKRWALSHLRIMHARPYVAQRTFQSFRLGQVLSSAAHIPYWRGVFNSHTEGVGFHQDPLGVLHALPLLRREVIQLESLQNFINPDLPEARQLLLETSGTTGEPLLFYQDANSLFYKSLGNPLWFSYLGFDPFPPPGQVLHIGAFKPWNKSLGQRFDVQLIKEDPVRFRKFVSRHRPSVVYGKVSDLFLLAEVVQTYAPEISFQMLLADAEPLFPQTKAWLERALGGTLYTKYASSEFGTIAVQCIAAENFHVSTDRLFVEIVNESGMVVPEMTVGAIVITALDNLVMPMIRFVTGDRGYLSFAKCECGFRNPQLAVLGREHEVLHVGHKRIYAHDIHAMIGTLVWGVRHWQVIVKGEKILVQLVPDTKLDSTMLGRLQMAISQGFAKKLGLASLASSISIEVETRQSIELQPSGKAKTFSIDRLTG